MLDAKQAEVVEERSTKDPLDEKEVRALLASVKEVVVARGRKAERRPAAEVRPDDLRGPTGNFRSPMLRRGRTLLVGFHPDALEELLGA
ncbi:MAG TPA: hypothetical protein VLA66_00595 [Thermoanaerobaculia bacterium]|nr:hypothetical protein [Thermoanaerobaculia bacterium]